MDVVQIVAAGVVGIPVGSVLNGLAVRVPGYVITDPGDLPEDADPALLDELEPPPVLEQRVPLVAIVRPGAWWRRWFPLVELATGALFALTVHRLGWGLHTVAVLFLVAALVVLSTVDFRVYRIPDGINLPAIAGGYALIVLASILRDVPGSILGAAFGGVAYATLLFLAHIAYPRGMGWGDVKLAWVMGAYLGWAGWISGSILDQLIGSFQYVIFGAAIGSLLGAVAGGLYAAVRRSTKAVFPYGPSLAVGCLTVVLFGSELI